MELGLLSTEAPAVQGSGAGIAPRRGDGAGPGVTARLARLRPSPAMLGIAPFVAYVVIFLGLPLYEVVTGAFTGAAGGTTFANFSQTLDQPQYLTAFRESLVLSVVTAAIGAVFGTWLAYAVVTSRPQSPLRRLTATGSGVLAYFAGVPLAFALIAAYGRGGEATSVLGHLSFNLASHFAVDSINGVTVAYVYFQIPLMVILITPALEGLLPQWREAAAGLGATSGRYWRHIGGPIVLPAFLGGFLLLFGNAFAAYATAYALTNGSVPLVPSQIDSALSGNVFVNDTGVGLALGVEMIVVVAIVLGLYAIVARRANRWRA